MSRAIQVCAVCVVAVIFSADARAAEVIYEPFDYPAGDINGTQTNGIGFATNGWTTQAFVSNPYDIISPGLTFTDLPTSGLLAARPTAPDQAEMNRPISSSARTKLLADNTTIWFSVLVNNRNYSDGNENGTMVIATGPITDPSTKPVTMSGGEGIGVAYVTTTEIRAIIFDDGATSLSSGLYAPWVSPSNNEWGETNLIAGKIEWVPNGGNDTIRLFNVLDPLGEEPADDTAFATNSADLDQSLFDTIAIGNQQVSLLDEIRFAPTYYEVMGREPPPPKGTVLIVR